MSIDSRLDPEIASYLERVQATMSSAHQLTATQMRESFLDLRMPPGEVQPIHDVQELQIAANHGTIKCRLYKPVDKNNLPLLVWYHGGGWVLGDLESADLPCRDIANKAGCMVLSVDYRLAPEHPFPAAFDDSLTALQWAFKNTAEIGADKNRIAIGGDSAGANLAACVCLAAKEHNIKYQLLIYPVIEADFNNSSFTENADDYFLTKELMQWFWDQYIPQGAQRSDVRVAPLSGELKGLPPAYVLTVRFDPLRDEGLKYAQAMKQAGVVVQTTQNSDAVHGFFTMPVKAGENARSEAAQHLKNAFM